MRNTTCKTTTVVSTKIATQDLFNNLIPDKCTADNLEDFEHQCIFSIFMSPSRQEICEYGPECIFNCCIETEDVPEVWFYYKGTMLTVMNNTKTHLGLT